MRTGQARKRDANEKAIRKALEAVGAHVTPLSGEGTPDLLVHFRGVWTPLEVKSKAGLLTTAQTNLLRQTFGGFVIVRSVDEALQAIGATRC